MYDKTISTYVWKFDIYIRCPTEKNKINYINFLDSLHKSVALIVTLKENIPGWLRWV